MRADKDRAAWTELITGEKQKKPSKYSNERTNGFASKKEARIAADLEILERAGKIRDLQMQVPIVLVAGRDGVKPLIYIADFTFSDPDGTKHIMDAKGCRTAVYKIKKKLLFLLHGLTIEEV